MPSKQTADYNFAFCVQREDVLVISISCVLVHVNIMSHWQVRNWYSGLYISLYKNGVVDILVLLLQTHSIHFYTFLFVPEDGFCRLHYLEPLLLVFCLHI